MKNLMRAFGPFLLCALVLTASVIRAMADGSTAYPPLFGSSVAGLVPASGGGTTNFLRADGTWAAAGGSTPNLTSSTGVVVQTGSTTYVARSVSGGTGISVSNGSGVSGNPTISLAGITANSVNFGGSVGTNGVVVGVGAGSGGSRSVEIGRSADSSNSNTDNVVIGYSAAARATGSGNTIVGPNATAGGLAGGGSNTLIGSNICPTNNTSNSIVIGIGGEDVSANNASGEINIGNAIYGAGLGGTVQIGIAGRPTSSYTLDIAGSTHETGARNNASSITTVSGSTSGTFYWLMPERGASYKKVIVVLSALTDAGSTITFPTAFTHTPDVFDGSGVAGLTATVSTTQLTLPATVSKTGTILVEGF